VVHLEASELQAPAFNLGPMMEDSLPGPKDYPPGNGYISHRKGKGKSSSKCHFGGICDRSLEGNSSGDPVENLSQNCPKRKTKSHIGRQISEIAVPFSGAFAAVRFAENQTKTCGIIRFYKNNHLKMDVSGST